MARADEWKAADERAARLNKRTPRAVKARYDGRTGRIVVDLSSRLTISFSPQDAQGLGRASAHDLREIEISPSGFGLHFPNLDADLYIPALLDGFFGSEAWMAARLGRAGGQSRSSAKRAASRENGKLGGRPRKAARGWTHQ